MRKKEKPRPRKKKSGGVIRLEDLAPRKPITGGAGGRLFGERGEVFDLERPAPGEKEGGHGEA